ncbi:MAG: nucleoside phosphorylase [Peptoniphilaceae bacterium]|nr:nucleoside phosphorylase [Peptoniphilaceae bacterium]MCI6659505.1 nucleoside phosphorylase [Peptoniphilaceae bacterium]MDY3987697.1 nucleoside phosphorylase [Peptoniphilaceae bacterium]MDY5841568.1 nucleoside phosphorylase [Peptoniphilaceae bacterium]MDY6146689.1 nucleoside phosphorylase [Peptoniphilaceae bacterium]
MIMKNEIPILEFDTKTAAVIMPTHENLDLLLPRRAVFAFLGEHIDEYAKAHDAVQVGTFLSATKDYPIYMVKHRGKDVCLCQAPVGAAPAAQLMDWLIGYGVREIITGGCCAALSNFEENMFLVPYKALRDEGTSYHYMKPSRFVEMNTVAMKAIEKTMIEHGLKYREVITWTTDGFYRETKEKVAYRKQEGCEVVEMECAALAACAFFRNVLWGCILFTADTLADVENYDERNWGRDSFAYALELCLDAIVNI